MVIAAIFASFLSSAQAEPTPAPSATPIPAPLVQSVHCSATGDLATYRLDYDRAVDAATLIFQSTSKDDTKKMITHEMTVDRFAYYTSDRLRFAIHATDPAKRKVEFAVAQDNSGREMGNDIWWYTEAIPSQLVKYDCKIEVKP